jgi:hypothetical protein
METMMARSCAIMVHAVPCLPRADYNMLNVR